MKFSDETEAVRIANDSRFGLNAFVQTNDLSRAHRVARQLEAGSVWVNTFSDISRKDRTAATSRAGSAARVAWRGLHEFLQTKNIRVGMR